MINDKYSRRPASGSEAAILDQHIFQLNIPISIFYCIISKDRLPKRSYLCEPEKHIPFPFCQISGR